MTDTFTKDGRVVAAYDVYFTRPPGQVCTTVESDMLCQCALPVCFVFVYAGPHRLCIPMFFGNSSVARKNFDLSFKLLVSISPNLVNLACVQVFIEQFALRPPWRPYSPNSDFKSVRSTQ